MVSFYFYYNDCMVYLVTGNPGKRTIASTPHPSYQRIVGKILFLFFTLLGIFGVGAIGFTKPIEQPSASSVVVDREILGKLEPQKVGAAGNTVDALVILTRPLVKQKVSARSRAARAAERTNYVSELKRETDASQQRVLSLLSGDISARDIVVNTRFWVDNILHVQLTKSGLDHLVTIPGVVRIIANSKITIPKPSSSSIASSTPEWNIAKIEADKVWNELGVTGTNVVVANLDTGVNWTHPALKSHYRGWDGTNASHAYNWFDVIANAPEPYDDMNPIYHGTHTMGTMIGSDGSTNQIGVAPGATWMAAKFLDSTGTGSFSGAIAAFQWFMAPTKPDGSDPDPTKAPDIINNSWVASSCSVASALRGSIQSLRAAGIVPVFAIGNSGPDAGSAASPGDFPESLGVGATDASDAIAAFSSRGPSCFGEIKPEVSAPGVSIRSSSGTGDYQVLSGTSMAAPHVAGTLALVLSAKPDVSVDLAETILQSTAKDLGAFGKDNAYGAGRINAFQAVLAASQSGALRGTVTDSQTSAPIAQSRIDVLATGALPDYTYSTMTDSNGFYEFPILPATSYTITASGFGYVTGQFPVTIPNNQTVTQDIVLTKAPAYTISGTVTGSGNPVSGATLSLINTPIPSVVTGGGGTYAIPNVPSGTYTMTVSAAGYVSQSLSIAVLGNTTRNIVLSPIPTIPLAQNFESGLGSWTATGMWHVENAPSACANAYEGTASAYFGKTGVCNFDDPGKPVSGELTSALFIIPNTPNPVHFKFANWYETEQAGLFDMRFIEIKEIGATEWTLLKKPINDPLRTWNIEDISLDSYKGKTVQVRFRFDSGDEVSNSQKGWYVDTISLFQDGADPSISQQGPATAQIGQTITYTLTYRNNGTAPAQGVVITDTWTGPASVVSKALKVTTQSITIPVGTLNPGQSGTVNVQVQVSLTATRGQVITNTAVISSTFGDDNMGNNSSQVTTTVVSPDPSISQQGPATAQIGQTITYTLTYRNNGTAAAQGVVITDTWTGPESVVSAYTPKVTTQSITIPVGTLNPGQSGTVNVQVQVSPTATRGQVITNTAVISSTSGDDNMGNNSSQATTTVVSAEIAVAGQAVMVKRSISHTITITNIGDLPAVNSRATLRVSAPFRWRFIIPPSVTGGQELVSEEIEAFKVKEYPYTFGTLGIGAKKTITFTVRPRVGSNGVLTAYTQAATDSKESFLNNNTLTLTTTVKP